MLPSDCNRLMNPGQPEWPGCGGKEKCMKAYLAKQPGILEIREQDIPEITRDDEVLMKVKVVGICGSDMHIFHGTNPFATYPRVWGHEFAGEVAAVGSGVNDLNVGDHIVAEPYDNCGKCYACRHGRGNVCENLSVYGVHQDGGCREYIVMKRAKVHKVPAEISWKLAALAEPLTVGFQSVARGRVEKDDLVLVEGAGTIGLTCLIAAKEAGARVMITDLFDSKLEYAKKFGADYLVNVKNETLEQAIARVGEAPNVILDGVCSKASLEQAVDLVSAAGRVVELGYADIASEIRHVTLMKKEVDVCGTRLQAGMFPASIKYITGHQDLLDDFVTQTFTADRLEEAFAFAHDHPGEVRKAQIIL